MVTIVRDRVRDMVNKGMTLEQVKASKPTVDYDVRVRRARRTGVHRSRVSHAGAGEAGINADAAQAGRSRSEN